MHPLDTIVDRKFRNEKKEKKGKKEGKNGGSIGGWRRKRKREAGKNENCTDTSVSGIFCFSCHH